MCSPTFTLLYASAQQLLEKEKLKVPRSVLEHADSSCYYGIQYHCFHKTPNLLKLIKVSFGTFHPFPTPLGQLPSGFFLLYHYNAETLKCLQYLTGRGLS